MALVGIGVVVIGDVRSMVGDIRGGGYGQEGQ